MKSFLPAKLKLSALAAIGLVAFLGFSDTISLEHSIRARSTGPAPGHTDAPDEMNCTRCHAEFPVNDGSGEIRIGGLPANYLPGQQFPLSVTMDSPAASRFGFQLTAIGPDGNKVGNYILPPADPQPLQLISDTINGKERTYIQHNEDGTAPDEAGIRSWNFTFVAPSTRVGKIRLFAAGNGANNDSSTSGDHIFTALQTTLSGSAIANFDNDIKSDVSVFRPSNGKWYSISNGVYLERQWGVPGDIITPGDFDGDGKTDRAVWRPSNQKWYIQYSSGLEKSISFGISNDIPVAADYDGDGKADIAVWRPSTGQWFIIRSFDGQVVTHNFGLTGDIPVPADYDGDAKAEYAIYRPSNSKWYIIRTSDPRYREFSFGVPGDLPVQGDYDGDGRSELAVYRPATKEWHFLTAFSTYYFITFGLTGDLPTPADFDGDGRRDIAVYRNSAWHILMSEGSLYKVVSFGLPGDIPIPRGYIPQLPVQ